jgi:hypothetical protein
MKNPVYELTLHKTYYKMGFFNLGVDVEQYIRKDEGPINILLGDAKKKIIGQVDRSANKNGTPRIFAGKELINWFQNNFNLKDKVQIDILSPKEIWLKTPIIDSAIDEVRRAYMTSTDKPPKYFQRIGSNSNTQVGNDLESHTQIFLSSKGITLSKHFGVLVGVKENKKVHKFDLGSESPKIIVECKSHKWTAGNNVPSAKMTVWNEVMFYFTLAPYDYRKIFFVIRDFNEKRGETLVDYYFRTYGHLIPKDVEIWEFNENDETARILE